MEVDLTIVWLVQTPGVYPLIMSVFAILDISILFNPKLAISIIPHAIFHACYALVQQTINVSRVDRIKIEYLINFSALAQQILKKTQTINVFQIVKILIVLLVIVIIYVLHVLIKVR